MENNIYTRSSQSWHSDRAQTITFIVTEDCNLRCKYCYITHKKSTNVMSYEMGKLYVDKLLENDEMRGNDSLILEFIGGEPFMEVKLIDKIVDYFKMKAFIMNHDWYWDYRISICTNGVNYKEKEVQDFISKNEGKLSLSITLDGIKEKHDMNRVDLDNKGSFDKIIEGIPLWLSKFPGSTKVTFSSPDLPLLFDSIVYLWSIGIEDVSANVVFEDVWQGNDDLVLEQQLKKLADYIIDNKTYEKRCYCSFFDEDIGFPYSKDDMNKTFCGAGKMLAFAPNGNIYPCIRYYGYSLNNHPEKVIGNVFDGIDMEKVRPFILSTNRVQSDEECKNCEIARGCGFCQGFNYDDSSTGTNFYRAKYICKMHKARIRANNYFFDKLLSREGYRRNIDNMLVKKLYFLMDDDYSTYCEYDNKNNGNISKQKLTKNDVINNLEYCRNNFYLPYIVYSKESVLSIFPEFEYQEVTHLLPYGRVNEAKEINLQNVIPIISISDKIINDNFYEAIILNIKAEEIGELSKIIKEAYEITDRINLNILNLNRTFEIDLYEKQLLDITDYIAYYWNNVGRKIELNVLNDDIFLNTHDSCGAGERTFVLAPDGKIYNCCGMYSENLEEGVNELSCITIGGQDRRLYKIINNNLCISCDVYHCKNCIFTNKITTEEINVSPSFQCNKSLVELKVSNILRDKIYLESEIEMTKSIMDPMERFINETKAIRGFYK